MLSRRVRRSGTAVASLCTIAACASPAPFAENQVSVALQLAEQITRAQLQQQVEAIYQARLDDPHRDATSYPDSCGAEETCVYSRAAAQLAIAYWSDLGLAPVEEVTGDGGFENRNVYVDLPGSTRSDELVLLEGHHDAWFGGANDNATGVAIVMEATQALLDAQLDRTVRLVLFDGEEHGSVGSNRYFKAHSQDRVHIALNLDMLGHQLDTDGGKVLGDPSQFDFNLLCNDLSEEQGYKVVQLAKRLPQQVRLRLLLSPGNGLSGFALLIHANGGSDNATHWFRDQPALTFFPAGMMPDEYHTPEDTPDKLHYDRLEMIARVAVGAAGALATIAR